MRVMERLCEICINISRSACGNGMGTESESESEVGRGGDIHIRLGNRESDRFDPDPTIPQVEQSF